MHGAVVLRLATAVVVASLACLAVVRGDCPTNGDPRVLYVTTNGDRGFHDVLMLDTMGRVVGTAINWSTMPAHVEMRKLRGLHVSPDGALYVTSARGKYSQIVVFSSTIEPDCTRRFERVLADTSKRRRYLRHPYDVTVIDAAVPIFDHGIASAPPEQLMLHNTSAALLQNKNVHGAASREHRRPRLFVANQNSISIAWMDAIDGTPLPAPEHTLLHRRHLRGGSDEEGDKKKESTEALAEKALGIFTITGSGEESAAEGYHLRSVRGVAASPDGSYLCVCDVDSDAVRVFNASSGEYLWRIGIPAPVQVKYSPPGFFNLDGSQPLTDVVPHLTVSSKTGAIYVAAFVDPREAGRAEARVGLALLQSSRQHQAQGNSVVDWIFGWQDAAADGDGTRRRRPGTQGSTTSTDYQRSSGRWVGGPSPIPLLLRPRVFASGFVAASGFEFDTEAGLLYVADRVGRRLHRLRFDGTELGTFGPHLLDQPEHIRLVTLRAPEDFPRCYEFGRSGVQFSVLCVAGELWLGLLIAIAAAFAWRRQHQHREEPPLGKATEES